MIDLPRVTLIALTGRDIDAHWKMLDKSQEGINFGAIKLIEKHFDTIDDWSKFVVFNLTDYVDTDYCILVHADGGIIHPELWDNNWLKLDFIGSPFPLPTDDFSYRDIHGNIQRVGNSVSLRSKKLLDLPRKLNMEWKPFHGFYSEDGYISVNMRHVFEEHGCVFGTFEQALKFGKEAELPENKGLDTFLFHKFG